MTQFITTAIIVMVVLGIIFKLLLEISNLSDKVHSLEQENENLKQENYF